MLHRTLHEVFARMYVKTKTPNAITAWHRTLSVVSTAPVKPYPKPEETFPGPPLPRKLKRSASNAPQFSKSFQGTTWYENQREPEQFQHQHLIIGFQRRECHHPPHYLPWPHVG